MDIMGILISSDASVASLILGTHGGSVSMSLSSTDMVGATVLLCSSHSGKISTVFWIWPPWRSLAKSRSFQHLGWHSCRRRGSQIETPRAIGCEVPVPLNRI